ncbi:hypothetical protein, partial [Klebsiella pneumoniae]|uniref:hypothetical protein n=1 Tax=Klebsiella pneumoniae TaxID=573 RepID=UPI001D0EB1B8
MSHGKCEPTNTNAADYKLYARFDAGETLESVLASPPTTKHNKVTSEGNIRTEHRMWMAWRKKHPRPVSYTHLT